MPGIQTCPSCQSLSSFAFSLLPASHLFHNLPLPFFFCTMLKPWNQETGIPDGSQINLEIAVKHQPEQTLLTAERSVVLLLTTCSLLFNTWCQSAFNSDVNKSCFSDCEVSAKHGFWDWRSCSPGPACLVYPLGDVTQQGPLKGSSTTVLHFEDTLKNPLSGTWECDDLMCHMCEQWALQGAAHLLSHQAVHHSALNHLTLQSRESRISPSEDKWTCPKVGV